jgi:hypothetical protein
MFARDDLELMLQGLATLRPRAHAWPGPRRTRSDHEPIDERGDPVIIDIEGLMFWLWLEPRP